MLLTPVFVVVAFAAFQAALWTNARTQVRAAARDAAVLVARLGAEPDDVVASTTDLLEDRTSISEVVVQIRSGTIAADDVVVVTITADAPGMLAGTSRALRITEALPLEGFRDS